MSFLRKLVRGSIILSYGLIALEILIMISPFAFYFYSFYGPSLKAFDARFLRLVGYAARDASFTHPSFKKLQKYW